MIRQILMFSLLLSSILSLQASEKAKTIFKNSNDHVLSQQEWQKVQKSINKGLAWLARTQQSDGSFYANNNFQPGVTSFAVMAFLSAGHQPGKGPYGKVIEKGIEYALNNQNDEGVYTTNPIPSRIVWHYPSHTSTYTHPITGLMLAECYGQTNKKLNERIHKSLKKALAYTIKLHHANKRPSRPEDLGGWRYTYIVHDQPDADLSVTGWHLMFMRAANSAGFEVPESEITSTVEYVKRCFNKMRHEFSYYSGKSRVTSAMTGAGVLCLALSGEYDHEYCKKGGEWLKKFDFNLLPRYYGQEHRVWPYYSAYYCSQAASQMGGDVWKSVYPKITSFLLKHQSSNGSWSNRWSASFAGNSYSTALAILSLSTQNQLLPIVQR